VGRSLTEGKSTAGGAEWRDGNGLPMKGFYRALQVGRLTSARSILSVDQAPLRHAPPLRWRSLPLDHGLLLRALGVLPGSHWGDITVGR
jgi:hypothetical protein